MHRLAPLLSLVVLAAPALAQPARLDTLDRFVEAEMAARHIPGLALAVVQDGAVCYARGYGFADLAHHAPATDSTAFLVASVTKTVTAGALLIRGGDGPAALDAPIRRDLSHRT